MTDSTRTVAREPATARDVKDRIYGRHYGHGGQMPGPWTVIEEFRAIDLLAFSAWSSQGRYARVGYEVKVSRADLRRELLAPHKRAANVAWCNEFYFAVPRGLLTDEELAYDEPEWSEEDFTGPRCPGVAGRRCDRYGYGKRRDAYKIRVPIPTTLDVWHGYEWVTCPTCCGRGVTDKSRVEKEAPTLWVPRDVGLVIVDGRGCRVHKKSLRRREVPSLTPAELGLLVRWVSMRPDPRHSPVVDYSTTSGELVA